MNFVHTIDVDQSIAVSSPKKERVADNWWRMTAVFRDGQKLADEIGREQEHVTQLELPLEENELRDSLKKKRKGTTRKGCKPFWVDRYVSIVLSKCPGLEGNPRSLANWINALYRFENGKPAVSTVRDALRRRKKK